MIRYKIYRKSKKRGKSRRKHKYAKHKSQKRKGGGCGGESIGENCMFSSGVISPTTSAGFGEFSGGAALENGPAVFPSSFQNVPIRSFYAGNPYEYDPNYLTVNARNTAPFLYGGDRSKSRKKAKSKQNKSRVMKGGSGLMSGLLNYTGVFTDPLLPGGMSQNPIHAIGSVSGVSTVGNTLTTNLVTNPASSYQATQNNANNIPLA